jgi:hypothetical protein
MPTEFQQHSDTIEECYEFTLSYAAQGHATDEGSAQGRQLRDYLSRTAEAMRSLKSSCTVAVNAEQLGAERPGAEQLDSAARYEPFIAVLARDAEDSIAVIEMVLAQPSISSQLIDNLNASIHLRALLTDIFLLAEILETRQARMTASQHEVM